MPDVYSRAVLPDARRLLARLDRDPLSPSRGCFDHAYWHDRIVDAPSLHDQEAVYALALLYAHPFAGNPYHGRQRILTWIQDTVHFWAGRQHRDGSLDEFYPWERQFGATAIVLWTMTETALLLGDALSEECRDVLHRAALRSARRLGRDEASDLTNHKAQALLALVNTQTLTGRDCSDLIAEYLGRIRGMYKAAEGWFAEYGGPDAGYQSVTLAFLARYRAATGDDSVTDMLHGGISFLSYAFMGGGWYGGQVFSRGTSHLWMTGFELLAGEHEAARDVCAHVRRCITSGEIFGPRHQDRYFAEQIYDWLYASTVASEIDRASPLPCEGPPGTWFFDEAGIMAVRGRRYYALASAARGGLVQVRDGAGNRVLDAGPSLRSARGGSLTAQTFTRDNGWDMAGGETGDDVEAVLNVRGVLRPLRHLLPTPWRFVAFRVFLAACAVLPGLSALLKNMLIRLLVQGGGKGRGQFKRRVVFSARRVEVVDILEGLSADVREVVFGPAVRTRFVAYAKAFHAAELHPAGRLSGAVLRDAIVQGRLERRVVVPVEDAHD